MLVTSVVFDTTCTPWATDEPLAKCTITMERGKDHLVRSIFPGGKTAFTTKGDFTDEEILEIRKCYPIGKRVELSVTANA